MNHADQTKNETMMSTMKRNKQSRLNKFLSKTYHMINQCDPSIAAWSSEGDFFEIRDAEAFASSVLPLYFKHSKYPSFVRQLNFYSFRKLRDDPDVNFDAKVVRFAHEYFQRGHPELLHQIQRSTKPVEPTKTVGFEVVDSLKHDIAEMNDRLNKLSHLVDHKLASLTSAVETDYQQRMANIELSYQALSKLAVTSLADDCHPTIHASRSRPPTLIPESPTAVGSSLLTLSGIASIISGASLSGKESSKFQ